MREKQNEREREKGRREDGKWTKRRFEQKQDDSYMNTICGCDCANEFRKIDRLIMNFQIYLNI